MSKLNRKKFSIVVAIFMILMLIFPLFAFASEEKLPFTDFFFRVIITQDICLICFVE